MNMSTVVTVIHTSIRSLLLQHLHKDVAMIVSLQTFLPGSLQDEFYVISMVVSLQSSLLTSLRSEFLQLSLLTSLRSEFL